MFAAASYITQAGDTAVAASANYCCSSVGLEFRVIPYVKACVKTPETTLYEKKGL